MPVQKDNATALAAATILQRGNPVEIRSLLASIAAFRHDGEYDA